MAMAMMVAAHRHGAKIKVIGIGEAVLSAWVVVGAASVGGGF